MVKNVSFLSIFVQDCDEFLSNFWCHFVINNVLGVYVLPHPGTTCKWLNFQEL